MLPEALDFLAAHNYVYETVLFIQKAEGSSLKLGEGKIVFGCDMDACIVGLKNT